MNIKTTLDALAEAYIILDSLGISSYLTEGTFSVEPKELVHKLLGQKQAQAFICTITDLTPVEAGKLNISSVIDIVTRFFIAIGSELSMLPGINLSAKTVALE
jgi:hypothetical protein